MVQDYFHIYSLETEGRVIPMKAKPVLGGKTGFEVDLLGIPVILR